MIDGRSARVLLVDDEPDMLLLAQLILQREGHVVVTAQTGAEAIDIVLREPFDALVLDIRLPDVEGWEVLERLEADGILPRLPVIVLSAHITREGTARAASFGCSAFISKPFRAQQLVSALDAVLPSPP